MEQTMNNEQIWALVNQRFLQSQSVPEQFFTQEAETIAQACLAMARRFQQGGRLLAFGSRQWASDAQHIAVEFVHPVIVGKRALPALVLNNDRSAQSDLHLTSFAHQIRILGCPQDIALGFSLDGNCLPVVTALKQAQQMGMLTLGLTGENGGWLKQSDLDFCFVVETEDVLIVQETHEILYHVLWELVHVFFEYEESVR